MIQQAIDAVRDAIDANIAAALSEMPGSDALLSVVAVTVTRHTLNDEQITATPVGVRVEQDGPVATTWPLEHMEAAPMVPIGITCWISRPALVTLADVSDRDMIRAVRAVCRAVERSIRVAFRIKSVRDIDGVQVRAPVDMTHGEPEQGDDAALTVMTMTCTVPALDWYAMGAAAG